MNFPKKTLKDGHPLNKNNNVLIDCCTIEFIITHILNRNSNNSSKMKNHPLLTVIVHRLCVRTNMFFNSCTFSMQFQYENEMKIK